MNWIGQLRATGEFLSDAPAMSAAQRKPSGKLTERMGVCLDHETQQRLEATARRLGVHRADLARAFIAKGLDQCL